MKDNGKRELKKILIDDAIPFCRKEGIETSIKGTELVMELVYMTLFIFFDYFDIKTA